MARESPHDALTDVPPGEQEHRVPTGEGVEDLRHHGPAGLPPVVHRALDVPHAREARLPGGRPGRRAEPARPGERPDGVGQLLLQLLQRQVITVMQP